MALLTKGQVRTAARQAIDDPQSKRWSDANLDVLITIVQDTMFQSIIDSFDYFTSQTDNATPSGSGVVALNALVNRFYRIQKIVRVSDSVEFQPKLSPENVPQPAYHILGNNIVTIPAVIGAASLAVTYSYLPTAYTSLVNDSVTLPLEYPEGHEAALIYSAASWAMTKGDAESMQQIARIADLTLDSLLSHISRRYPIAPNMRVQAIKAAILRNPLIVGAGQS